MAAFPGLTVEIIANEQMDYPARQMLHAADSVQLSLDQGGIGEFQAQATGAAPLPVTDIVTPTQALQ